MLLVNIDFKIITELFEPCTIHSGQNYTILNLLWQSKDPFNVKDGHGENDVIFHRPSRAVRA